MDEYYHRTGSESDCREGSIGCCDDGYLLDVPSGNFKCFSCRREVPTELEYCTACGVKKGETVQFAWKCKKCGLRVSNRDYYCEDCGCLLMGMVPSSKGLQLGVKYAKSSRIEPPQPPKRKLRGKLNTDQQHDQVTRVYSGGIDRQARAAKRLRLKYQGVASWLREEDDQKSDFKVRHHSVDSTQIDVTVRRLYNNDVGNRTATQRTNIELLEEPPCGPPTLRTGQQLLQSALRLTQGSPSLLPARNVSRIKKKKHQDRKFNLSDFQKQAEEASQFLVESLN